ncbi:methionine biosynthesis protein MetW [Methanosarcina sp. T3]|uniref:class I SAM-dependent methyltransferase n=1 Tax=Methanosarcina sp. T3 TaxID=3439062 RepID=UPI003F84DBF7
MDSFDINTETDEEEINVEEIMRKIRENISERKGSGFFPEKNMGYPQRGPFTESSLGGSNIQRDLEYLNSNWDIQNNSYFISSHRSVVGKFLIKGRELVHGEVRRYVDPVIWKQTEFNGSTVRLFNDAADRFTSFDRKIEQLQSEMDSNIEELRPELENKIEKLRLESEKKVDQLRSEMDNSIKAEVSSVIASINLDLENKAWLAGILEGKIKEGSKNEIIETSDSSNLDINYFRFEEQFRGSREDIKQRQSHFMHYFVGCSNVLDIGCGRGEFLELAKELGIGAKGIDIDDMMVDYCISKGLNVERNEAISYLEKLDDKSFDGIFIDQVVEHLEPSYLINLLQLCFQKLKYGYYIFVETVNPLSLFSFANFYIDMTHKKPVHPETLKFLLASAGFRDLDTRYISPVSEEARLQKVPVNNGMEEWAKNYLDTYNRNIEKLNNILYGAQDYAVIGKK